jgi:putative ABC transport system permease protein
MLWATDKTFRQELLNLQGVQNASISGFLPTGGSRTDSPLFPDASMDQKTQYPCKTGGWTKPISLPWT